MSEAIIEVCQVAAVSVGLSLVIIILCLILLVILEIATSKDYDEAFWEDEDGL